MASEIRVNTFKNRSGLGTVSINDTGASFSGVVTATSFSGDLTGNVTSSSTSTFSNGLNVTGGSVGIGTDNPGSNKLQVQGGSAFYGNGGASATWGDTSYLGAITFDGNAQPVIRAASSKALVFQVNQSTEAARFNTSGNLAFPSGQGIDFSANSNAAGMTSELLDDYEEGTFTPTFTAGTVSGGYTRQVGEYTKVGRLVTFTLTIDGDGNLQGAAQAIEIGGLPFTSRHVPEIGGAIITYPGNFDTTNNRRFWLVAQNNTTLSYRDSSSQNINGNAVTNVNSDIVLCGQYFTDS
jgi:hypothetical protein